MRPDEGVYRLRVWVDAEGNYLVASAQTEGMAFYAVGTRAGKETAVADDITAFESPHIHAALAPSRLQSYILVEADGRSPVEQAVTDTPYATKVLPGQTSPQEALSFLNPGSTVAEFTEGDVVEVTAGAYEGKRARVQHIDTTDEMVTVELHEEPIPLPVSVKGDQLRAVE